MLSVCSNQCFQTAKSHRRCDKYMVNHGIAHYVKDILRDDVRKSDRYVVLFDEFMNDITDIWNGYLSALLEW